MNSSLQNVNLTEDEVSASLLADHVEEHAEGEEGHVHLPNPSLWPLILTIALVICIGGFIFWPVGSFPWFSIVLVPFVLLGMLGLALEDPMAPRKELGATTEEVVTSYAQSMETGKPTALAEAVLHTAQEVAERTVTVGSTAWSAHPVQVEIEREGVVLALYGKVELEAQRKELEEALLRLPGVIDVRNFLIAEDALLNAVNARIEALKATGKLDGAKNLSVLVENYIVSLDGYTPTKEMKYMLEREIVSIPGVRVVINHIGLNEDIPGNLGKTNNKVGK